MQKSTLLLIKGFIQLVLINSLAPRESRCGSDLQLVIFKLISRKYLEHFLWNCHQVNATRPHWWWLVKIGRCLNRHQAITWTNLDQVLTQYSITRLQWVKRHHLQRQNIYQTLISAQTPHISHLSLPACCVYRKYQYLGRTMTMLYWYWTVQILTTDFSPHGYFQDMGYVKIIGENG